MYVANTFHNWCKSIYQFIFLIKYFVVYLESIVHLCLEAGETLFVEDASVEKSCLLQIIMEHIILSEVDHGDLKVLKKGPGCFLYHDYVVWFEFVNIEVLGACEFHFQMLLYLLTHIKSELLQIYYLNLTIKLSFKLNEFKSFQIAPQLRCSSLSDNIKLSFWLLNRINQLDILSCVKKRILDFMFLDLGIIILDKQIQLKTRIFIFLNQLLSKMQEEIQAINNQYEETMKKYNELKQEIKRAEERKSQVETLDREIEELKLAISQSNSSNQGTNLTPIEGEAEYFQQIQQLKFQISEEERLREQQEAQYQAGVNFLKSQIQKKNQEIASTSIDNNVHHTPQISQAIQVVQSIQNQKNQLLRQIQDLENTNNSLQQQLNLLTEESLKKQQQFKQLLESNQQNELAQRKKIQEITKLEKELAAQQDEAKSLQSQIQAEQKSQNKKNEEHRQAQQELNSKLSDLQEVRDNLLKEIEIKEKERNMERGKLIVQNNKLNEEKQILANLDKEYHSLDKHSQDLEKRISELKINLRDLEREEQKQAKQKNKGQKNYKLELVKLQNQTQQLEKQLQREQNKYQQILKVKSTYVDQSQLVKLQNEYNKLQEQIKPIQSEEKKNKKLMDENKQLKDRIAFLKKADEDAIRERKQQINQIKAKNKHLLEQKAAFQKTIQQNQNKLNEYMKQFPNHELEKESKKKSSKKHLTNDNSEVQGDHINSNISGKQNTQESDKANKNRRNNKKGSKSTLDQQDDNLPPIVADITKGNEEIYKDRNAQVAVLGLIVIIGLLLGTAYN